MKFALESAGNFYTKDGAEKLRQLGFEFVEREPLPFAPNETMFKNDRVNPFIEIQTLDELLALQAKFGALIIENRDDQNVIVIYDDHLE